MCYHVIKKASPEDSAAKNIYHCLEITERTGGLPKWESKSDRDNWNARTERIRKMGKENGW